MKMYEMLEIRVDAASIAIGILKLMTDDEHVALSIGMLPGCKLDTCRTMITDELRGKREYQDLDELRFCVPRDKSGGPDFDNSVSFTPREVIDEIMNDITQAMYAKASMIV